MKQLGIIGAGKMATAIVVGALKSGYLQAEQVLAYDVNAESLRTMSSHGVSSATSLEELAANCRYLLLSVKPQVAPGVLTQLGALLRNDTVIISIAAGLTVTTMEGYLGHKAKIMPVMPNTPLMVGAGATAVCRVDNLSEEEFSFGKGLFAAAGIVEEIPADKLNEIIPIQGSSPAYIYLLTKYFCEYAVEQGIDFEVANRMFCQMLVGSAKMMTEMGMTHQQLMEMVSSPGGTTLAGLRSLEEHHLKETIQTCCEVTVKRAYELGAAK
ncbi:MAG: pyrroline-5-carboxylate reductase [Angelakisella sp.]